MPITMYDREQAIVSHITEKVVATRLREFFVISDPEINIQVIAQALVNNGYAIEEYSFGEQKRKDGTSIGVMHRLVLGTSWEKGKKDQISLSKLEELIKNLSGK
jgi:hypothetical protein